MRHKGKEVPGAVPGIFTCVLVFTLLHSHQGCSDRGKGCLHFANEETEAQRYEGPCPRSHSYQIAKPGLEVGQQPSPLFKLLSLGEGVSPTFHPLTCPSPNATWSLMVPAFGICLPETGSSSRSATFLGSPITCRSAHRGGGGGAPLVLVNKVNEW